MGKKDLKVPPGQGGGGGIRPEGTVQTSPDTPGGSLPQGQGFPVAARCPEASGGWPWVTPVSAKEHLPLSFRAPPGAEAVVPVSLQAVQRL